jgi:CII-binding regulator of phage lambda lysogenization HflD
MNKTDQTLTDFKTLHGALGEMFKDDGITDEARLKLAGQLTISSQLKELTDKVAALREDIGSVEQQLGHIQYSHQTGINEYLNK